jgi:uncharacterized protein YecE (DUF72 family)
MRPSLPPDKKMLGSTDMARAFIGTSGWNYKHWWNDVFYAKELTTSQWLPYFSQTFDTVEINNSFYRLPSEDAFTNWRKQVPNDFIFAVKASRFLTHIKRLKDPEEPLELFFSRARHLRKKLGPILFQLPPRFKCNIERLERFLEALRHNRHGKKARVVLEVRDRSWLVPSVYDLLADFNVCLCFADWRDMPVENPVTADFVYVRRHYGKAGDGNYGRKELNAEIKRVDDWRKRGLDTYIYFNNDWNGHALKNAIYLQKRVGQNSGFLAA